MKQNLRSKSLVRYIVAGGASYAIELSCLLAFHRFLGLSVEAATAIAFWAGLTTSFLLQKLFAFKDYRKTLKSISKQLGAYALLIAFNYVFTLAVVAIFPSRLVVISRTLALIATTVWNYIIYKKFIFKTVRNDDRSAKQSRFLNSPFATLQSTVLSKKFGFFLVLSFPILIFFWQYLATGSNKTMGGDFDYYSQLYEAFRISVLKFHQFPLWNPWLSGGIPLHANPQFGLFSLQSLLVLPFGAIYGLKLAYTIYGVLGFWGMYLLGRRVLEASKLRSALISYIWVFGGFFAGHGVWHFTFTSFFLLPWLIYFIDKRKQKYSWLWLGVIQSVIILSSVHYAFLMMTLAVGLYFVISLAKIRINKKSLSLNWEILREDVYFVLKAAAAVVALAGYQLYHTYHFVAGNQRLTEAFTEPPNSLALFIKSLFLPIGTFIKTYPKTTWGWGEYSMYIGMGTGLALLACLALLVYGLFKHTKVSFIRNRVFVVTILIVGLIGASFAVGNFGHHSPFYLLHTLPGFTQTRTPTRWLIITVFSLLVFLLAWQRNKKLINALLFFSVIELFLTHGPPRNTGKDWTILPPGNFSASFQQYDNGRRHIGTEGDQDPMNSYYYTTLENTGQIYADDSLINTKSGFTPLPTRRCGYNLSPNCTFVMTHNARVSHWSPNKIVVQRSGPGAIELNMNVESGWRINDTYPFINLRNLEPVRQFVLPPNQQTYVLEYAPRFSPAWVHWRLQKL